MADVRTYRITLTGKAPLLMHADNIEWADVMNAWSKDPAHKNISKAGDDRSPAWRWLGAVYHHDGVVVMPAENIMCAILEGAAKVLVPKGKNSLTFKDQSQSGIMSGEIGWPLLIRGRSIDYEKIDKLNGMADFTKHDQAVVKLGFRLYVKRAAIGRSKHIRVRPRFDRWSCTGTLIVSDDEITTDILRTILEIAGNRMGLGDWRPSSKTPGPFGRFSVEMQEA